MLVQSLQRTRTRLKEIENGLADNPLADLSKDEVKKLSHAELDKYLVLANQLKEIQIEVAAVYFLIQRINYDG